MTDTDTKTRTVTVEREFAYPPEKLWRALTRPHLLGEWLMQTDFEPVMDRVFTFRGDWGSVGCKVLAIEPGRSLRYSWEAMGLESVVTFTLTPAGAGTHLKMEQAGFRADQTQAFQGAKFGWQKFFGNLDQLLARGV